MATRLFYIYIILFVCLTGIANAAPAEYKEGELLVRFAPKADGKCTTEIERNQMLTSIDGGEVKHSFRNVPGLTLVKLPENSSVEESLPAFRAAGKFLYVEPNYKIRLLSTIPNDLRFNELWGLHNTGQSGGTPDADIDAPQAWDIRTSSDIVVAVIDTGVDYTHPDLAANMWVNETELNGITGVDDDENDYIDDIRGWDFADVNNNPMDYSGHGTHVAGIIGARGNNSEGVTGVCWNVKIMALKFIGSSGSGYTDDAIAAIDYAVDNDATVINASWGGAPYSQSLKDEIEAAGAAGVLFVAAAGNDEWDNDDFHDYPSGYNCSNIISVMATDASDERALWPLQWAASNWGATSVDLGAPGSDILSCVPCGLFGCCYYESSGTSMSAPYVAGACALAWSTNPALGHLQVKDVILNTVDELDSLSGLCVTGGRLNLYNAVTNTPSIVLNKVDDVDVGNSVLPDDDITYIIYYANPITNLSDPKYVGTLNNVKIVDYLPADVDIQNPLDPGYNITAHTYTWNIVTLEAGNEGSVTLTVTVNDLAEPLGTIKNRCVLTANEILPVSAFGFTNVNRWNPGVVYVDVNALGSNTGMSWLHAYNDLQDALDRAGAGCGSEIRVARGTYCPSKRMYPTVSSSATFQLANGVPVYGGFPSGGGQRNRLTNETILDGCNVEYVVLASGVNETAILDGFTIKNGLLANIEIDGGSPTIIHNTIKESEYRGIDCYNSSSPYIIDCNITANYAGIYCSSSDPNIINCSIVGNETCGIWCSYSEPNITNCMIAKNRNGDFGGMYNDHSSPTITNCIFSENTATGVSGGGMLNYQSSPKVVNCVFAGNSAAYGGAVSNDSCSNLTVTNCTFYDNSADYYGGGMYNCYNSSPVVTNCILWGNQAHSQPPLGHQIYNYDDASNPNFSYCDIEGGLNYSPGCGGFSSLGSNNIKSNPCFHNAGVNDFHLETGSPCIDEGNNSAVPPLVLTDIDGEDRIIDGNDDDTATVDMGADEYYWSKADFNNDANVNFLDYALLAKAWWTDPCDPNYNEDCNLNNDGFIDYNDLRLFCEDWLWEMMAGGNIGVQEMFAGGDGGFALAGGTVEAYLQIAAEPQQEQAPQIEPLSPEVLAEWLDSIWQTDEEIRQLMSVEQWQAFVESVKQGP